MENSQHNLSSTAGDGTITCLMALEWYSECSTKNYTASGETTVETQHPDAATEGDSGGLTINDTFSIQENFRAHMEDIMVCFDIILGAKEAQSPRDHSFIIYTFNWVLKLINNKDWCSGDIAPGKIIVKAHSSELRLATQARGVDFGSPVPNDNMEDDTEDGDDDTEDSDDDDTEDDDDDTEDSDDDTEGNADITYAVTCLGILLRLETQGYQGPVTDNTVVDTDTIQRFKDLLRLVDGVKDDETTVGAITCIGGFLELIGRR
ncbi:hypothetical protein Q9L58_010571 [Maublancomyces gigas]|uniref:Uncharacterized protein n=1 Tax=Discina gigas TaxID=1032678 RepID=A0ABR3G4B9_9PEZI